MFEITGDDSALLQDADLRTLIGFLCESEVRSRGISTSSVTWGGHQDAADGGLDVRVTLPADLEIGGFIPRPLTALQVKTEEMPPSKIWSEMRPHDVVRPLLRELATRGGAYIIVSSKDSCSDSALKKRCAEAVKDLENSQNLALDFYDRRRLATWVRNHAGAILWVRERIGKAIAGWRSYGGWAYDPKGVAGEYLLDDTLRVQTREKEAESGIPVVKGIERIRERLAAQHGVVRLVGLSGVGKTRLAQALFDDRVGKHSLNPSLAVYTNMADDPSPQPTGLASDLIATQTRAIIVVDNCTPELHKRLSELRRSPQSKLLSVSTLEYDIREDQPEGTNVFDLQPSSTELIEKLIKHRFPAISLIDARTIANFAGGNARIAIALASTVETDETITGLKDEELFQRLFHQRHEPNESLLLTAQACSLAYSFEGENVSDNPEGELVKLGALVGQNAQVMFQNVSELKRRDLVQQRSVWRAVLPHAIANRLAALALQNIPPAAIQAQIISNASERLLKSFTRRLGYLHTSKEAIALVSQWLGPGGMLGKPGALNDLGRAMFQNVAPVAPGAALLAIERALLESNGNDVIRGCASYIHVLRSLAYDGKLFERCVALILTIVQVDDNAERLSNGSRDLFKSLFYLYLSGTHATIEQRLSVIQRLLMSDDVKDRKFGQIALKATLEADSFSATSGFEFGAHSRDHGYWPDSGEKVKHWFRSTLTLVERLGCSDGPSAILVREVLAEQFSGLWAKAAMYDELEVVCRSIVRKQFWPDGWIAVRRTQHFWSTAFKPEVVGRLASLEEVLRPVDLKEKVRSMVLRNTPVSFDLDLIDDGSENIQTRLEKMEATAQSLGKAVVEDEEVFADLLADLMTSEGRLTSFGSGLALSADDPRTVWDRLVAKLAEIPTDQRKAQIFCGFLQALRSKCPELTETLLDNAVESETLGPCYPILQAAADVDEKGVDRLIHSLDLGKAPFGSIAIWAGDGPVT